MRLAARILGVQMRERLPAATETKDLDVVFTAPVGSALDNRVEAGNIAATGENTDTLYRHQLLLTNTRPSGGANEPNRPTSPPSQ
jgi:hypothetical protein